MSEENQKFYKNLKVGDKVIISNRFSEHIASVTRLTKTQIIVGMYKFRRRDCGLVGASVYSFTSMHEATEDSIKRIKTEQLRKKLVDKIREVAWHNQSNETLININNILDERTAKKG
jgi:hypothetical protein